MLTQRLNGVELGAGSVHKIAAETLREFLHRGAGTRWFEGSDDDAA